MKVVKITYDHCLSDITYTSNYIDFRIVLDSEQKASLSGAVTSMHIDDPLPKPKHFCHSQCLKKWIMDHF